MSILFIILLLQLFANGQDIIFEHDKDTACKLKDGGNGICKDAALCPEAYENFPAEIPIRCGFNGNNPVVCCAVKIDRVTEDPLNPVRILDISPPNIDFNCGDSREQPVFIFDDLPAASSIPFSDDKFTSGPNDDYIILGAIGGEPARFVLVKYSVIVGSRDLSGNPLWFCTGVLINQQWVITAAHCVDQKKVDVVRLGEHDYRNDTDGASPVDHDVIEVFPYPEYKPPSGYHDVALLKLRSPVTFNSFINPVCLPWGESSRRDLTNTLVSLTGWGATEFGGSGSSSLQEVNVTIFSNSVCQESYSKLRQFNTVWSEGITPDLLCAGDPEGGKDACQGDSGGPVVYLNENNQYVLAGVVSRGYGCGLKDFPGIYANIHHSEYLHWVKKLAFQ